MGKAEQRAETNKKVFDFVKAYITENGYAPKYDEIGDAVGISSPAVTKHIKYLHNMGLIEYQPRKWRSIQLIEKPTDWKEKMMRKFMKGE